MFWLAFFKRTFSEISARETPANFRYLVVCLALATQGRRRTVGQRSQSTLYRRPQCHPASAWKRMMMNLRGSRGKPVRDGAEWTSRNQWAGVVGGCRNRRCSIAGSHTCRGWWDGARRRRRRAGCWTGSRLGTSSSCCRSERHPWCPGVEGKEG